MKKKISVIASMLVAVAAVLVASTYVVAGNTQVSASSYVAVGKTGAYYGRSDGLYQEANSKGIAVINNGTASGYIGPSYRETFGYGAGKGYNNLIWSSGATAAGATTTVPVLLTLGDGVKLVYFPIVTETLFPITVATGLDIAGDLLDDDGLELAGGVLGATGRPFIIGDDPAFYFCTTVMITDVSGTDDFHIGFRRAEPFTAVFDNYNDLASIGNISGNITIETILNNAATTTTDTTDDWADLASKKLCTYVSAAGVVTYTINGAAPTVTATFTFDDGDPVVPFVHLLHSADIAESTILSLWEVGYQ